MEQNKNLVVNDRDGFAMETTMITDGKLCSNEKEIMERMTNEEINNTVEYTRYKPKNDRRNNRYTMSDSDRFTKTIHAIKAICDLAGYTIDNRVILRDQKTGQVWR